jgi:uncharacterized membrane protein
MHAAFYNIFQITIKKILSNLHVLQSGDEVLYHDFIWKVAWETSFIIFCYIVISIKKKIEASNFSK